MIKEYIKSGRNKAVVRDEISLTLVICSKRCNFVNNVRCSYKFNITKSQNLGAYPSGAGLNISCQDVKPDKTIDMIWRCKPGHFPIANLIAKVYEAWATCSLFGSLKR